MIAIDAGSVQRAQRLAERAQTVEPQELLAEFAALADAYPDEVARLAFLLAMMADHKTNLVELAFRVTVPQEVVELAERQAHAAFARGIRTPAVIAGQRAYDARRIARKREYRRAQSASATGRAAA